MNATILRFVSRTTNKRRANHVIVVWSTFLTKPAAEWSASLLSRRQRQRRRYRSMCDALRWCADDTASRALPLYTKLCRSWHKVRMRDAISNKSPSHLKNLEYSAITKVPISLTPIFYPIGGRKWPAAMVGAHGVYMGGGKVQIF
jgi:hypothetical protein